MKISIVFPIYNEERILPTLFSSVREAMRGTGYEYEIIAVDDGSKDRSRNVLEAISKDDRRVKVVHFRSNMGQTMAIRAGIEHTTGDVIVTMDSDLENDPRDIPRLLEKLSEGYDIVSGWRKDRWERSMVTRKVPSIIANAIISRISGLELHDYGCTLKAYRKEVLGGVHLYGEMHRFIPAYAFRRGARIAEIPVTHHPRRFGKSNYGFSRTFHVLLDLLLMRFLQKYMQRPIHFFGGIGFASFFFGIIAGSLSVALKILGVRDFVETPLPIFSALLVIVGVQLVAMGVLAEMVMRVYYEKNGGTIYEVKEKINFD